MRAVKNEESPQKTEVLVGALIPKANVPIMESLVNSGIYTSVNPGDTSCNHHPNKSTPEKTVQEVRRAMDPGKLTLLFHQTSIVLVHSRMVHRDTSFQSPIQPWINRIPRSPTEFLDIPLQRRH